MSSVKGPLTSLTLTVAHMYLYSSIQAGDLGKRVYIRLSRVEGHELNGS